MSKELVTAVDQVLCVLSVSKTFIDNHDKSEKNVSDYYFAVLSGDEVCPIRKLNTVCCLNPMAVYGDDTLHLLTMSTAGNVKGLDWSGYNRSYIQYQKELWGKTSTSQMRAIITKVIDGSDGKTVYMFDKVEK